MKNLEKEKMGNFEIPKFEVPTFYEGNTTAQKSAVSSDAKDKEQEKVSAKKTFESVATKASKVKEPVTQAETDALWADISKYQDEETKSINFPQPDDWNETLDTDDDGKVDSHEIQVAKKVFKEKQIKEVEIAKEEMDIIHEEDVKSEEIKTDGSSIVFRDNDETTQNKKIDNTNPDKKDGDFVMELDGSEDAKQTITTFGTDYFYTPSYFDYDNNEDTTYETIESKSIELNAINYAGIDTTEEELKKATPIEVEKLDYLLDLYLVQNKLEKANLTPHTLREIKIKLLKNEREAG